MAEQLYILRPGGVAARQMRPFVGKYLLPATVEQIDAALADARGDGEESGGGQGEGSDGLIVSAHAAKLMEKHGLTEADFAGFETGQPGKLNKGDVSRFLEARGDGDESGGGQGEGE